MQLMRELIPSARIIAVLVNPRGAAAQRAIKDATDAAQALRQQVLVLQARDEQEIEFAFSRLVQQRADVLCISNDPFRGDRTAQIVALARRYSVPANYPFARQSIAGGLLSYGTSRANGDELNRQAGIYVGRILKGEKPGDLPIMQPTRFELVLNLKAAKAIGLTIPEAFLQRADEVIE